MKFGLTRGKERWLISRTWLCWLRILELSTARGIWWPGASGFKTLRSRLSIKFSLNSSSSRYATGSLSLLHIDEKFSRKSDARDVVSELSRIFATLGYDVTANVLDTNTKTQNILANLGYKRIDKIYWMVPEIPWKLVKSLQIADSLSLTGNRHYLIYVLLNTYDKMYSIVRYFEDKLN